MNLNFKNKLTISLIFGFYQTFVNLFFESEKFLHNDFPYLIYFAITFLIISVLEFSFITLILKSKKKRGVNKLIFSTSFMVVGFLGSTILFFIYSFEKSDYLLYLSSFIIASFFPTIVFLFYFIFIETKEKLAKIGNVSLKEGNNEENQKVFHLENANGRLLLEVPMNKIICFEANDNYVITYYLKKDDHLAKSMERISLKKIEEMLISENVFFNRVHKSYLINPIYVDEIKGKAQAYRVKMYHFEPLIPVSRSYNVNLIGK